jgi:hypothetical protein
MSETKLFKENVIAAGVKSVNDIIKFEFPLKEDISGDQIFAIRPDCGSCTKAKLIDNKIVGTIDVSKAGKYEKSSTPMSKIITIYLNDGRHIYKGKEGTKEFIADPKKEKERLNVAFVVKK